MKTTPQLLHEDGAFISEEGRQFFELLKSLVKSSEVLPRCYKLQGLRCDFTQVREGGTFADIFEGKYKKRKVCVKAVRMFQKEDNSRVLRVSCPRSDIILCDSIMHVRPWRKKLSFGLTSLIGTYSPSTVYIYSKHRKEYALFRRG